MRLSLFASTAVCAGPLGVNAPLAHAQSIETSQPLSAQQAQDWDCLEAATVIWRVQPLSNTRATPTGEAMDRMRLYYLGRLSAELGDARIGEELSKAQSATLRSTAWARNVAAACRATMERSSAVLAPLSSRSFGLQPATAASPPHP